jgi:Mce-associated membrane protein
VPSPTPPRRRPGQPAQPVKRPRRVAGLQHPTRATPAEEPAATEQAAERTEVMPRIPAEPEPPARQPPAEPERSRPSGKRRPRPTPKPQAEREPAPTAETPAEPMRAADTTDEVVPIEGRRRPGLAVPLVLAVVTVVLGGLAVWFGVQWSHARGSSANTALADAPTTAEVAGQVTSAVNAVFSYDYTNLAKTQQAVPKVLTGTALCQYNELFKQVKAQAPGQKLVLTTTVQDKGVELLQGDRARVLLALDQHDTRAQTNQTTDSQAVIAVNAIRQGGVWKISSIDTFNGANPTSCRS